jgi:hypothetical protein
MPQPKPRHKRRKKADPTVQKRLSAKLTLGAFIREAEKELALDTIILVKKESRKQREIAKFIAGLHNEKI